MGSEDHRRGARAGAVLVAWLAVRASGEPHIRAMIVTTRRPKRQPPKPRSIPLAMPAIVTARKRGKRVVTGLPDMTPEEHQRRGDAAEAVWRELVRRSQVSGPSG